MRHTNGRKPQHSLLDRVSLLGQLAGRHAGRRLARTPEHLPEQLAWFSSATVLEHRAAPSLAGAAAGPSAAPPRRPVIRSGQVYSSY